MKTAGWLAALVATLLLPRAALAFATCQDAYPTGGTLEQHCAALSAQAAHCVTIPYQCQCPGGACDCIAQAPMPTPPGSLCSIGDMDTNDCTSDVCDGAGNCAHAPYPNDTPCLDEPGGNPCTYDYCTAGVCRHVPTSGYDCATDYNDCTLDICQAGTCAHLPRVVNYPCVSDNNACTSDVCNGAGACTHPNPTGGKVCNAQCIAANTCCTSADCASIPNGSGSCLAPGSLCVADCNFGYRACNGTCISSSQCCGDIDCNGNGHVCSAGTCTCGPGKYECGGVCIPNNTCCAALNNCPAVAHGTGVCPGNGGTCMFQCEAGYQVCGGSCIPNTACCSDAQCASLNNPSAHRHGVCTGSGCVAACDASYKSCNGACIPITQCCSASDCITPANGCYKMQGSCNAGTCTYPLDDGAACNADNDACTPNDRCANGSCVADTAHLVTCYRRDCHTAAACNKTTGNCEDSPVGNGTTCGANGCSTAAGTCSAGTCSSPPKDCSALSSDCRVGMCDASQASGAPCATANKPNGLACAIADKCVLAPVCSGGLCTGERKTCTPSGPCRVAECNPGTGECEEAVVPVGTACGNQGGCLQNAVCDATGACAGSPLPDGSPCDNAKCDLVAACATGTCVCVSAPDFGSGAPIIPDQGDPPLDVQADGCAAAPGLPGASAVGWLLAAGLVVLALRRGRNPQRSRR